MDQGTIISIVIIVVALVLIAGLIGLSYLVKRAGEKRANAAENAAEEAKEEAAETAAEETAEEAAEEPVAEEAEEPAEEPVAEEAEAPAEEPAEEEAEEEPEAEEEAEEPEEEAEAEAEEEPAAEIAVAAADTAAEETAAPVASRSDIAGESLIVGTMSPAMREALGVVGAEHDEEVYSVRYSYSFKARLVLASEETKDYYSELAAEFGSYKNMRRRDSRRQQNVSINRQRVAAILFKGKKLCLALALDPKEFEGTKYRGKDVSAMKRFAATPMLFKVDSARRIKYAKVLIARLAEEYGLKQGTPSKKDSLVPDLTRDELIAAKELKVSGKKVEPED